MAETAPGEAPGLSLRAALEEGGDGEALPSASSEAMRALHKQYVHGEFEAMKRKGQARAIGVSNFEVPDLTMLAAHATEPIEANQCHFAVGEIDTETLAYCKAHGIALESYGTLHGGVAMDHPTVAAIAARHKVSAALVMLRYVSQHGITIVTASDNLE